APALVNSASTKLSVLGTDDEGESGLTYIWSTVGTIAGAVSFSANRSNAAKSTMVTFTKPGMYTFRVTVVDSGGLSTTSNVSVTVVLGLGQIIVTPGSASVNVGQAQQFAATAYDQFGQELPNQPTLTWAAAGGG